MQRKKGKSACPLKQRVGKCLVRKKIAQTVIRVMTNLWRSCFKVMDRLVINCLFSHDIFLCILTCKYSLSYLWIVKEKLIKMDIVYHFFLKGLWLKEFSNFENILAFLHFCLKLDLTKDKLLAII